uniref:Uncharacterized protein n=1 Tax=Oryza barthii TaxID=65489 RepID=A0A0D3GY25_9ORYZ
MGNVGLASSLPPTRSRPLGTRRRLRARLARPPTPWHGFALSLVAPPSWRTRSGSMVVTALAHQLAGPPSPPSSLFRSLGVVPLSQSALHPAQGIGAVHLIGRLRFAQRQATTAADYAAPNGQRKCTGPSPHMWAVLGCSACGPLNCLGSPKMG